MLGADPSKAVLALDFDQTLTLVRPTGPGGARQKTLRGGEEAREALDAMAAAGVRMCIVTAQSPSAATVQNAADECRALGIAELFGVQEPDLKTLRAALASGRVGGPPPGIHEAAAADVSDASPADVLDVSDASDAPARATPNLDDLTARLLLLLLLQTGRAAADLVRLGASNMRVRDDGAIAYRAWNDSQGVWGAEQVLPRNDATPKLCPVRAWTAYAAATKTVRDAAGPDAPDRLLLSPSAAARGVMCALAAEEAWAALSGV